MRPNSSDDTGVVYLGEWGPRSGHTYSRFKVQTLKANNVDLSTAYLLCVHVG